MKLATYSTGSGARLGVIRGDRIVDLDAPGSPSTMLELIQAGPPAWAEAEERLREGNAASLPLGSVRLLSPLPNPPKIVAIGLNYMDHCREQNVPVPDRPLVFAKFSSSIIGPGDDIVWDPALTQQVDYEAELGVVIGRRARRVSVERALEYVFGYTIVNDVSARDLQFPDKQWVRGKSLDTFCPLGPFIVTADEIPDPQALAIKCRVNGRYLQNSSTSEMIFGVRELVARLSQSFTFEPGDLIATGTPDGVGVFRRPPVFLQDGDTVIVEIEGIGQLENRARTIAS
ncbi:MAG: fumarylacetoacetate hydrolase [Candidatus Aminicenantes bacterium RBG_16_63_16]|nr:MAG: fumarylacetoacetate hydrolase [Candidatus Aminicenantes bacterium RBG_16_63_16]